MDINKQLFEDVLSGKLKGTFVLRNGYTLDSKYLKRTEDTSLLFKQCYPYALINNLSANSYTENGEWSIKKKNSFIDIIDFIPNTDMKENELTIEIPEGKIVDWDESKKQNKIVLKDKQLTYKEVCEKVLESGDIERIYIRAIGPSTCSETNDVTSEHQLECILAKNKLANIARYLNDGWKPSKTTSGSTDQINAHTLYFDYNNSYIGHTRINTSWALFGQVLFKTKELAQQAIEILGEETVKLALEPLGI